MAESGVGALDGGGMAWRPVAPAVPADSAAQRSFFPNSPVGPGAVPVGGDSGAKDAAGGRQGGNATDRRGTPASSPSSQSAASSATLLLAQSLGQSQSEVPAAARRAARAYGNGSTIAGPTVEVILPRPLLASGRALDLTV